MTGTPHTAAELLAALRPFAPTAAGERLRFARRPAPGLMPPLRLLHTGVRAALTGQPWYWYGPTGRGGVLPPHRRLPRAAVCLCVAGDARWVRVHPNAADELPDLFEPEPKFTPAKSRRPDGTSATHPAAGA